MKRPILLVCSVEREMRPLLDLLSDVRVQDGLRVPAWRAHAEGTRVLCVAGGMGKTNAAHAVTAALCREPTAFVVGFGIGGAYPPSGMHAGEVAIARADIYADEGSLTPTGWISCEEIGIPLFSNEQNTRFNEFPTDPEMTDALVDSAELAGIPASIGIFTTVSTCSGTLARGAELNARYGAICESMEGAAYAHTAALYDAPFAEIRGISNLVEDRDPASWEIDRASEAAARVLHAALLNWDSESDIEL